MHSVSFKGCYDFSCWVIKYNVVSAFEKIYLKDSLKNGGDLVPLLWNHNHHDPDMVIGAVTLEYRDEGVYAYGKLFDKPNIDTTKLFLKSTGSVSLSPFVTDIKYDGNNITQGVIREVSLIFDRVDRDEAYFPIMANEEE